MLQPVVFSNLTLKGQVVIPKAYRDFLGVKPGGTVIFKRADGHVGIFPVPTVSSMMGFVKTKAKFKSDRALNRVINQATEEGILEDYERKGGRPK